MKKPRRIRRILKWAGVVGCTAIGAAAIASWWIAWGYNVCKSPGGAGWGFGVGRGGIVLCVGAETMYGHGWYCYKLRPIDRGVRWSPYYRNFAPRRVWDVGTPLWIPFLLTATPTAFLLWRDRRRIPPGHCLKCGYNLKGNVSGVCPECGTKIERVVKAPRVLIERPP